MPVVIRTWAMLRGQRALVVAEVFLAEVQKDTRASRGLTKYPRLNRHTLQEYHCT